MTLTPVMPKVSISKLTFSGSSFDFTENQIVILVGPNNSGKSQTLREIVEICRSCQDIQTKVIKNLVLNKQGTVEQLKSFLDVNSEVIEDYYHYGVSRIYIGHLGMWNQKNLYLLDSLYIKNITANDRLSICEQQQSISSEEPKTKPQHVLYDNASLMEKISNIFEGAFGKKLLFNFRGGSKLPIHVGILPEMNRDTVDRVSDEYIEALKKLPLLDKQGDGMKSYAGILFESIVTNYDITLIDEPEAFLHPPQMKKLGETLAKEIKGQLFVATHSSDILRGFLEGTKGNIRILRINRVDDINIVMEANESAIKELWEKPVLRYSNALEGIFHEQTIICEDDSDCRLINSVADYLASNSSERWEDTAYIPAGGKYGIPKIANILRKIGVPTKAVFDIDFLSEERLVEETVSVFGGDWESIKILWKEVHSAILNKYSQKSSSDIKSEILDILQNSSENDLPSKEIITALKKAKPWHEIKNCGAKNILRGGVLKSYNNMIKQFEEIGIYLVEVGEIENFCREINGHGPKFVTTLLTAKNMEDEDLGELKNFVEKVHLGKHCKFTSN
ncbi:ATP-dependent nuclease [Psychrobacter sp. I-STPA10]|uniref:ATP-dependent nuclease n=1 Tax=Psychrobacter sp. I-STPA10 TaxID=2585769 RepID=UPI001E459AD6|nr:AAA family ATPase [Psychrobacter sp. I-STPA10]